MSENKDLTGQFIPPRSDLLFRWIFGDKNNTDLVTDLLRAILPDLPEEDWARVEQVDPHQLADHDAGKHTVLDVKVTTATGRTIDIEVQLLATPGIRERITYYAADLLTGSINRGDTYTDLRQAVTVVIAGVPLLAEEDGYHHVVDLRTSTHQRFTDVLAIHILELPRIPRDRRRDRRLALDAVPRREHRGGDDRGSIDQPPHRRRGRPGPALQLRRGHPPPAARP